MVSDFDGIEIPQPLGLYAGELFDRANEYLEAFEILSADDTPKHPAYFLCAHSLELFLKSYLAASGSVPKRQHDLVAIFKECRALSMPDVQDLKIFVSSIFEMNEGFDFRYPSGFQLTVPNPEDCSMVLRALRETISPIIGSKRLDANLQFAGDTQHDKGKKVRWSD
jgi:HEPN domain-containing protein